MSPIFLELALDRVEGPVQCGRMVLLGFPPILLVLADGRATAWQVHLDRHPDGHLCRLCGAVRDLHNNAAPGHPGIEPLQVVDATADQRLERRRGFHALEGDL
jgi:hypothetical protein